MDGPRLESQASSAQHQAVECRWMRRARLHGRPRARNHRPPLTNGPPSAPVSCGVRAGWASFFVASGSSPGTRSIFTRRPARRPRRASPGRGCVVCVVCVCSAALRCSALPRRGTAHQYGTARAACDAAGGYHGAAGRPRASRCFAMAALHVCTSARLLLQDTRPHVHGWRPVSHSCIGAGANTRPTKQLGSPPAKACFYLWAVPPSGLAPSTCMPTARFPWALTVVIWTLFGRSSTSPRSPFSCGGLWPSIPLDAAAVAGWLVAGSRPLTLLLFQ